VIKIKAALYCRVSTVEQAEDGFSISAQARLLTEYCKREGIEIFKIYMDEGISGQKENRPQFQEMLKDAQRKLFNVILVHKFDRFARKVELSQKIKNQLKKTNINVVSITEPIDDSPMGFFVGGLHELMAEYYIKNLSAESRKGHLERAKQGYHNGSVCYGYRRIPGTKEIEPHPEQSEVVKLIFDLYNHKGYGSTKIAMWLNEKNIPTAVNGTWSHYTVNRVLKNVKYIGKIYFSGQIYEGKHEAIISDDEFNLAQTNIYQRTWKTSRRGANFEKFMLLGLVRCGVCGCVYSICLAKNKKNKTVHSWVYYKCNNYSHYDTKNPCTNNKTHNTHKLETYVTDYLKKIMNNASIKIEVSDRVNYANILEDREKKIKSELDRAKKAYLAEVFTLEEYKNIKEKLSIELQEIQTTTKKDIKAKNENNVRNKIRNLWDKFEITEAIPEKRAILQQFIDVIYIYPDKISIIFYSH